MLIRKRLLILSNNFDLFFSLKSSLLFIKGTLGLLIIKLPSLFFILMKDYSISFLFLNRFFFISVFKHFSYLYRRLFFFNYVKLKIRGLGYRIKKVCSSLFYFFFGHTNFFYFHVPQNVIVRSRKRKLILLSNNLFVLKLLLAHLLLLKKLSVYRIRGLLYPKQIVVLKIGKKNL